MDKKQIFAILMVVLMFMGAFAALSSLVSPDNPSQNSPALSSISETSSNSIAVNYFTQSSVANSGTTTVDLPVTENSSYTDVAFDYSNYWSGSFSPGDGKWTYTVDLPYTYFYSNSPSDTVELSDVVVALPVLTTDSGSDFSSLGTIYGNLSLDGHSYCYDYNPQYGSGTDSTQNYYVFFDPQWTIDSETPGNGWAGTTSVTFTLLSVSGDGETCKYAPSGMATTNTYAGSNIIKLAPTHTDDQSVPFALGYHFASAGTSFNIPEYETSYDITWSSSLPANPQYAGQSPSGTSGTLTGSLTSNSFTVYSSGDPAIQGGTDLSFSYYLSSQCQVSPQSTTQTSASSYTYAQVAGTTNEASSSFSFSGSTPTGTVFVSYETGASSLSTATSNLVFTPTAAVSNPYYSYAQNELAASISGASSGSGTSSNTANPSFAASSASYTSSATPSWNVTLDLYGNVAPAYVSGAMAYSGTSSTANLYFNVSQPDFNGEAIFLDINWGDGTTSSTSSTDYNFMVQHTYAAVGTYSVSVQFYNEPDPDSNGLSNISGPAQSFSYTISIGVTFNPPSLSVLQKGGYVNVSFSAHNDKVSSIVAYENGVDFSSDSFGTSSGKMVLQPSDAGVTGFTLTLDFYGAFATYSAQYAAPLYPLENSSYLVQTGSNNATHIYPITLSNVPSGSGTYQQLITISNPSGYGINTAGSNIQFVAGNGTLLYAWEQSINSTSMQVWVKNYNGSSIIDMQVFPGFENLFSANGYLGENPNINSNYNNWAQMISGESLSTVNANPNEFVGYGSGSGGWENVSGVLRQTELTDNTGGNGAVAVLQDQGAFYNDRSYSLTMTFNYTDISTPPRVGSVSNMYPYGGIGDNGLRAGYRFMMTGNSSTGQAVSFLNDEVAWVHDGDYTTSESTDYTLQVVNVNGTYSYSLYAGHGTTGTLLYSITGVVYSANNRVGDNFGFIGVSDSATSSTYSTGGGSVPMNVTSISISILGAPSVMPTYSIGAGSVFLANSSLLNYPSAGNTEPYNSTYERVLYTIPDAFNYNYMTLYYNDTWTFLYADPSYEIVYPQYHAITFSGISGVSSVQITMLQPIIKKVQPGAVSVSQIKGFSILSPGASVSYTFALSSQGSPLSSSVISGLSSSSSFEFFSASTGLLEGEGFVSPDGSNLNVTFTAPPAGLYYFKFSGSFEYNAVDYSYSYSGTFNSSTSKIYSEGLDVKVISPSSLTVNSNATLLFQLYFPNGTSPTSAETSSILANSSLSLKSGNITLSKYNSFTLAANFSESIPANYTLEFSVSKTMISGNAISYIQLISIPVVPKAVHVNNNMKMSVSGSSNLIAGVPSSYIITFLTGSGIPFNSTETSNALKGLNITVKSYSKPIAYGNASIISNGSAAFNLTLAVGTYYLLVTDSLVLPSGNASSQQSVLINVVNQTSRGISISISIAGTLQKGHPTQGIISVSYTDGAYMSYLDTISIANSLIINVYTSSGTYLYSPASSAQSPGKIAFDLNISAPGSYTVYASYNGTVSGIHAAGSSSQSLSVVNYNPSQNTLSTITSWLDSFWIDIVSGIVTAFVLWIVAKLVAGKKSAKKSFNSTAAATTVGIANYEEMKKSGQKIPINPKDYKDINKDIKKVGK